MGDGSDAANLRVRACSLSWLRMGPLRLERVACLLCEGAGMELSRYSSGISEWRGVRGVCACVCVRVCMGRTTRTFGEAASRQHQQPGPCHFAPPRLSHARLAPPTCPLSWRQRAAAAAASI